MRLQIRRLYVVVIVIAGFAASAMAQTAGMQHFQGVIRNDLNEPISVPVDLQFRIYDAESGGNLVDMDGDGLTCPSTPGECNVGQDVKLVENVVPLGNTGIVSVKFGPVAPSAFSGGTRWLEVSVSTAGKNDWSTLSRVEMATPPATAEQLNARGTSDPAVVALPNGNVGIGTLSPSHRLVVDGSIATRGSNQFLIARASADSDTGATSLGFASAVGGVLTLSNNGGNDIRAGRSGPGGFLRFFVGNTADPMVSSNGIQAMTITNSGRIGIGTTDPQERLSIQTGSNVFGFSHSNGTIKMGTFVGSPGNGAYFGTISDHPLHFFTNNNPAARMSITSAGNVGIGTTNPSQKLHVAGSVQATCGILTCSDARYKKNVEPIADALGEIEKLQGVAFDWKTDEFAEHDFREGRQVGFIAQEIEKVLPQVVSKGTDGYLSVDYGRLTPVLVEAVKTLKSENDQLMNKVDALERRLAVLEAAK